MLGVLPLGTLNNFSKDLNIPQEIAEAVRVIGNGRVKVIDTAEVNGRIFLNNSSIGLYPNIVLHRERQQRLGRGKWISAFWAALRMFRVSPFLRVDLELKDHIFRRKTPFVLVGNNAYEMDLYNIGRRNSISAGKLSVYFLHKGGRTGVAALLLRTIFGKLRQWKDFEAVSVEELTIFSRRKKLNVAFDGEVRRMSTPLRYKTRPGSLKVLVHDPGDV